MRTFPTLFLVLFLAPAATFAESAEDTKEALKVTVDVSEVPDLKTWGDETEQLIREWHPKISELLKQDGFTPPHEVSVVFKKDMDGVAHTIGNRIFIAANWVKQHPEDKGMVVHELVHVIQAYPPRSPFWLVEGIADYIRFYIYEPQTRLGRINPKRQSYRDGYRTSAQFVAWIEKTHGPGLVQKVNEALRKREYQDSLLRELTGKNAEQLWADFTESEDSRGR